MPSNQSKKQLIPPNPQQFPFTIPDAPGVPRVTDWDGSSATLIWDRPRSDGGARIQGYKLEFRDVQDGVWNSADYLVKDCTYQVRWSTDICKGNTERV